MKITFNSAKVAAKAVFTSARRPDDGSVFGTRNPNGERNLTKARRSLVGLGVAVVAYTILASFIGRVAVVGAMGAGTVALLSQKEPLSGTVAKLASYISPKPSKS